MSDADAEWRQERIAKNEESFRAINERLESGLKLLPDSGELQPFICECGSRACSETVNLTLAEYEAVRAHAVRFAVLPGHVFSEAERILERHDRYYLIEKTGVGAAISKESDPRRNAGG